MCVCVDVTEAPARRPGTNITNQVNSRSAAVTKSTGTGLSKSSVGGTKPGGDTGSKGWFVDAFAAASRSLTFFITIDGIF